MMLSSSATGAASAPKPDPLSASAKNFYVRGHMLFKGDVSTPKSAKEVAMVLRGNSPQLILPFSMASRLTESDSKMIGLIVVLAVSRDERFRRHEVETYDVTVGTPAVCKDPRIQIFVGQMVSGQLDRDEQLASAREDFQTVQSIQTKKINALRHAAKCGDCGLTLKVRGLPLWHLQRPIWELLRQPERERIKKIVDVSYAYATVGVT